MFKGFLAVALASAAYGVMPVFTKNLLDAGMSSQSVVLYRFLLSCLLSAGVLLLRRTSLRVSGGQLFQLCFFGVCGFGLTSFLLYSSYAFLPVGLATMFHFSYPLFVTLLMILVFRERGSACKYLSVLAAVGGMVLMADLSGGGLSVRGVLLAAVSGVTYAVYVVAVKKSSFGGLDPIVTIFYVTLFSSVFFFLRMLPGGPKLPPDAAAWGNLLLIAGLCTVFALCLLTVGIRILGATNAAVLNMLEPLTSLVAGMLVFGERISPPALAGCGLILLSVLLVSADARKKTA